MNTNAYAMKVDCNPFDMGIFSDSLKTQVANSANKTIHPKKIEWLLNSNIIVTKSVFFYI